MGLELFTLNRLTKAWKHSIISEILFGRGRRTKIIYALTHLGKCNVTRSVSTLAFLAVGIYFANTMPINLGFLVHYLYVFVMLDPFC
jgi:tetrahydromethanopterin S-methyltransferase subunit D